MSDSYSGRLVIRTKTANQTEIRVFPCNQTGLRNSQTLPWKSSGEYRWLAAFESLNKVSLTVAGTTDSPVKCRHNEQGKECGGDEASDDHCSKGTLHLGSHSRCQGHRQKAKACD